MKPDIWGPCAWIFLHFTTMNYPNNPTSEDRANYKRFFYALTKVLPCEKCQKHLEEHINHFPIDPYLDSPNKLAEWLVIVHNRVNKSLGKKEITIQEFEEIYSRFMSGDTNPIRLQQQCLLPTSKVPYYVIGILLVLLVGSVYYFKRA